MHKSSPEYVHTRTHVTFVTDHATRERLLPKSNSRGVSDVIGWKKYWCTVHCGVFILYVSSVRSRCMNEDCSYSGTCKIEGRLQLKRTGTRSLRTTGTVCEINSVGVFVFIFCGQKENNACWVAVWGHGEKPLEKCPEVVFVWSTLYIHVLVRILMWEKYTCLRKAPDKVVHQRRPFRKVDDRSSGIEEIIASRKCSVLHLRGTKILFFMEHECLFVSRALTFRKVCRAFSKGVVSEGNVLSDPSLSPQENKFTQSSLLPKFCSKFLLEICKNVEDWLFPPWNFELIWDLCARVMQNQKRVLVPSELRWVTKFLSKDVSLRVRDAGLCNLTKVSSRSRGRKDGREWREEGQRTKHGEREPFLTTHLTLFPCLGEETTVETCSGRLSLRVCQLKSFQQLSRHRFCSVLACCHDSDAQKCTFVGRVISSGEHLCCKELSMLSSVPELGNSVRVKTWKCVIDEVQEALWDVSLSDFLVHHACPLLNPTIVSMKRSLSLITPLVHSVTRSRGQLNHIISQHLQICVFAQTIPVLRILITSLKTRKFSRWPHELIDFPDWLPRQVVVCHQLTEVFSAQHNCLVWGQCTRHVPK